jgi:hypothetical protein
MQRIGFPVLWAIPVKAFQFPEGEHVDKRHGWDGGLLDCERSRQQIDERARTQKLGRAARTGDTELLRVSAGGQRYVLILCDLERIAAINPLPDRDSANVHSGCGFTHERRATRFLHANVALVEVSRAQAGAV